MHVELGIRVEKLEQLREVIAREERDIKICEQMLKKKPAKTNPVADLILLSG
jgi:hypothetical protein